jgi:hypothetical protein
MITKLDHIEWRKDENCQGGFKQLFMVSIGLERMIDTIDSLSYEEMYSLVDNIVAQEDDGALQDVPYTEDTDYYTYSPEDDSLWVHSRSLVPNTTAIRCQLKPEIHHGRSC